MDTAFLLAEWLGKPLWMWLSFLGIVSALLALDLFAERARALDHNAV